MGSTSPRSREPEDDLDAVERPDAPLPNPTRVEWIPLWEAKWNEEALRRKWRPLSSRVIARGFRQVPISDDQLFIKPELVDKAKDRSLSIHDVIDKKSFGFKLRRFGGYDIAGGEDANSAYTCIMVIGIDPKTKHRYVLGVLRKRGMSIGKQFAAVADMYDRYQWECCGVESNGIQQAIERHFREEGVIPTRPIHTGSLQKHDENVGIPALFSEIEHGLWHIPDADPDSRILMAPFVEELKSYPTGKFSDTVMAAYFANYTYLQAPKGRMRVDMLEL